MKNEIGRKLTSLTIMAIMFAGGMAIGVPSFMPEAASDLSETSGLLTVRYNDSTRCSNSRNCC